MTVFKAETQVTVCSFKCYIKDHSLQEMVIGNFYLLRHLDVPIVRNCYVIKPKQKFKN